jgi:RimJ/RimL family protein N-acetyltransferase
MIIRKYGLELREVEREDLELIRQYRNSEAIKNKMIHREQISREQQQQWFEEIKTIRHFYFLIYKNDTAMGLINGKNINFKEKSSEGGIFIWNEDRNFEIAITASIILNDFNFFINNFQLNYAQVLKSNKQAIAYNEFMGYKMVDRPHEREDVIWMTQQKADYIAYRKKLEKLEFSYFNIHDPLKEEDIFILPHEREYAERLIAELPQSQQELYNRILERWAK